MTNHPMRKTENRNWKYVKPVKQEITQKEALSSHPKSYVYAEHNHQDRHTLHIRETPPLPFNPLIVGILYNPRR